MRLNLFLARAGSGSRREADAWIRAGRVRINGREPEGMGADVDPARDRVTLDGALLALPAGHRYAAYHKPPETLVSRRSQGGKRTIFDALGTAAKGLMPVGRLDYLSEGLLLLTDDGALAEALLHPRTGLVRSYRLWVLPVPDPAALRRLEQGAIVEGRHVRPIRVVHEGAAHGRGIVLVDVAEGKKREVRLLAKTARLHVERLVRVRFGPIHLGDQRRGTLRALDAREIASLRRAAARPL